MRCKGKRKVCAFLALAGVYRQSHASHGDQEWGLVGWSMRLEDVHACGKLGAVGAVMRSRAQGIWGEHDKSWESRHSDSKCIPLGFQRDSPGIPAVKVREKEEGATQTE